MVVWRSCRGRCGPGALESGFQLDSLVDTYIADCMYTELQLAPDLPEVYHVSRGGPVQQI